MTEDYMISLGGPREDIDWLKDHFQIYHFRVAAGSGAHPIIDAGFVPDVLVEDLNSVDDAHLRECHDTGSQIKRATDLNSSDFEKAINEVLKYDTITIDRHIGGCFDKSTPSTLCARGATNRRTIHFISRSEHIIISRNCVETIGRAGDTVGVFSLDEVEGLYFLGLEYSFNKFSGPYVFGWNGTSNELSVEKAAGEFAQGVVLALHEAK